MRCDEIIKILNKLAPEKFACDWDNVGLLCGHRDKEVHKILVTLVLTDSVLEEAVSKNVDMIVSHHPMIFRAVKNITDDNFIGRRLIKLIGNDISYYAMHTNFDMAKEGMSDIVGKRLGINDMSYLEIEKEINIDSNEIKDREENKKQDDKCKMENIGICKKNNDISVKVGIGGIGELSQAISLELLCQRIKSEFDIETLAVYGGTKKPVKKIAVCPGAGEDYINVALQKKVDVYITGDIKHHAGLDAAEQGLTVIDATHFGLEHIFVENITNYLKKNTSQIEIIAADIKSPVTYF